MILILLLIGFGIRIRIMSRIMSRRMRL